MPSPHTIILLRFVRYAINTKSPVNNAKGIVNKSEAKNILWNLVKNRENED